LFACGCQAAFKTGSNRKNLEEWKLIEKKESGRKQGRMGVILLRSAQQNFGWRNQFKFRYITQKFLLLFFLYIYLICFKIK